MSTKNKEISKNNDIINNNEKQKLLDETKLTRISFSEEIVNENNINTFPFIEDKEFKILVENEENNESIVNFFETRLT